MQKLFIRQTGQNNQILILNTANKQFILNTNVFICILGLVKKIFSQFFYIAVDWLSHSVQMSSFLGFLVGCDEVWKEI